MGDVRLLRLSLRNFKGIKDFTLDAAGGNVSVFGDNATGKTTLVDAFHWLLFDKDSANRKDFDIKTLSRDGEPLHGLEHEVEGILEVDGKELTLRKVYSEKWTKRRGSATKEFTGHTTDHFVNGVPVKKAEYDARIAGIAEENAFRLLTDPSYFNEVLHWQNRRRILLEVCGDVSDEEVIAGDRSLADLPGILGDRTLEEHRRVIMASRTRVNRELEKIPVRIDEVRRGLPDVSGLDGNTLASDVQNLRAARNEKEQELARLQAGGEIAEKKRRLAEVKTELLDLERQALSGADEKIRAEREALRKVNEAIDGLSRGIRTKQAEIEDEGKAVKRLEERMNVLRDTWHRQNDLAFEHNQDETCPTCGQAIPKEPLAAAREKALTDFNLRKARTLEEISAEGKAARNEAESCRERVASLEKEIREAEGRLKSLEAEAGKIEQRIETLCCRQGSADVGPKHGQLAMERDSLEQAIARLQEGGAAALDRVTREISRALDEEITVLQGRLAEIDQHEKGLVRIEDLKGEERALAAEYERLEKELYLTEQFVRTKVSLLEGRINSRFKYARFRLFNILVNGGIEECCETVYEGVPYSTALNRGARMNVGLDIINTLSEQYGFEAPMVVSEPDKRLRVEHTTEKNAMKEAV